MVVKRQSIVTADLRKPERRVEERLIYGHTHMQVWSRAKKKRNTPSLLPGSIMFHVEHSLKQRHHQHGKICRSHATNPGSLSERPGSYPLKLLSPLIAQ